MLTHPLKNRKSSYGIRFFCIPPARGNIEFTVGKLKSICVANGSPLMVLIVGIVQKNILLRSLILNYWASLKRRKMKINLFIFMPILAILAVCVFIFTACKEEKEDPPVVEQPIVVIPDDDYTVPSGFDRKKTEDTYGTLTEKSYSSKTTGATRKCLVYTPPGYDPKVTYPVMYLLHGIGGTHTEWLGGNPNEILSNLINAGKAKPMIVVMPNVRAMKPDSVPSDQFGEASVNAFHNFINDLSNDLMPFISKNYPVSNERHKRAIAGLSMGGMESIHIGIRMPETFGYIGAFSAAPALPLTPEQMTLPDKYKNNIFIMICCAKDDTIALGPSQSYNQSLVNNGVETTYYELNTGGHGFGVWKNGLYNFARRIF
jgi:enterochelin esterase-like enzyme